MKYYFCLFGLLAAAVLGGMIVHSSNRSAVAAVTEAYGTQAMIIIDAGHGGEDGGARAADGAKESNINLEIARRLDYLLALYGVNTMMLREEDVSLHDSGADTIQQMKSSDLKNRVAAVESVAGATLVSIHQNSFPQKQYYGAQVFYADTEGSQQLARDMQVQLRSALDPENKREAKQIADTIYLMNHISCRAVLVECGFLSNAAEAQLLQTELYQKKIVASLTAALIAPSSGN